MAVVAGFYTTGLLLLDPNLDGIELPITEAALAAAAGLLLGMRLHFAYDRWWEGRKLWGTLVNVSRNLAVKIAAFVRPARAEAEEAATSIAAFAYALKDHLRAGATLSEVPGLENRSEDPAHVPVWIVGQIYDRIHDWRAEGHLIPHEMRTIDDEARILLDVCGACERIRNTSMPPSLAVLSRFVSLLAVLFLPVVLIPRMGWWSVAAAAGAAFFLVVVETTSSIIEDPFGTDPNQLDLDGICVVIRDTTREALLGPTVEHASRGQASKDAHDRGTGAGAGQTITR